ncbi:caspase family protein [candidate division WOR-3 bacterium]|nr:caspase family protein [candidate division WOR-3 bacterium]
MISALFFFLLMTAKSPEFVVSADTIFSLPVSGGRASFRLFEDRYIDIEVSVSPPVPFVIYGEDGNILSKSERGRALLNTFFNYWFSVKFSGISSSSLSIRLNTMSEYRNLSALPLTGTLNSERPSEVFLFSAPASGVYEFSLSSSDRGGDIDLKLYTGNDEYLTGGLTDGNNERARAEIFSGETIRAIVYLNDISKTVNFSLNTSKKSSLRELTLGTTLSGTLGESVTQNSLMIPSVGSNPVLLYLNSSGNDDADLDLYVETGGEMYKSVGYTSRETILIPPYSSQTRVTVKGFSLGEASVRYSLTAQEVTSFIPHLSPRILKKIEPDKPFILGVTTGNEGYYYFQALSSEKRDVDLIVFDGYGTAGIKLNTLNPLEMVSIWLGRRDTVYLLPLLYDNPSEIELSFGAVDIDTVEKLSLGDHRTGTVRPPFQGVKFYSLSFPVRGTAVVRVRGESTRDRDVDLFVSGKDFYRRSEGSENPTDMASDETILFEAFPGYNYLAQVYAYGRGDRCRYDISTELIDNSEITGNRSPGTLWALIIGISGYPGESSLNRASQDALEFYELLVNSGIIEPENTVFLADENATRQNILESLKKITHAASSGDKFIFFFSGHGDRKRYAGGILEPDGYDESICPYSPNDEDGDIFDDELNSAIPIFLESYIFLDACHSGGFVADLTSQGRRLIITASEEDREVGERVLTPLLLRTFKGEADIDRDGWLNATEIISFIREKSRKTCPECLHEYSGNVPRDCVNCGVRLTGENRPMDPELGVNFDASLRLFELKIPTSGVIEGGKDKR